MKMTRAFTSLAVLAGVILVTPVAAASKAHRHHAPGPAGKTRSTTMMNASLKDCTVRSAIVNLVPEDLLTRTAITMQTIDSIARPVTIAAGDPRIADLNTMLHQLRLAKHTLAQIEMRTLIRVTCADGTTRTIAGSKTESDGTMHLDIDGSMARTDMPVRRMLETMVAEHAR
jgi:hypothetical protein